MGLWSYEAFPRSNQAMLFTVLGLTLASLVTATSIAPAQNKTNITTARRGRCTLTSKSGAVGVGVSWADEVFDYRGQKYKFSVKGLDVLANGNVSNLTKLEDASR